MSYPAIEKQSTIFDAAQCYFENFRKQADDSRMILNRIGEEVMNRLNLPADVIFLSAGLPEESEAAEFVQFSALTSKQMRRSDRRIWETIIQITIQPSGGRMVLWEVIGVGFELGKGKLYMDGKGIGAEFCPDDLVDKKEAARLFVVELERHWIDVIQSSATFTKDRREITGFRVE